MSPGHSNLTEDFFTEELRTSYLLTDKAIRADASAHGVFIRNILKGSCRKNNIFFLFLFIENRTLVLWIYKSTFCLQEYGTLALRLDVVLSMPGTEIYKMQRRRSDPHEIFRIAIIGFMRGFRWFQVK